MTVSTLPKIVRFTGKTDGGPCDDGPSAYCPHCGTGGRYIYWFITEDGERHGAMAGCLKLFPVSPIADKHRKLIEKEADLMKRYGKDAHLNSWQQKQLDAIERFYAGDLLESNCLEFIKVQEWSMQQYRTKKYGKRSW